MDQELPDAAAYVPDRCFMCTHQMAALFCVKWRHGLHPETVTSNQKSDSVNQYVLTWRTLLPNFIPIWFEKTEPWAFLEQVTSTRARWVAIWHQFLIQKQIVAMTPKILITSVGMVLCLTNMHDYYMLNKLRYFCLQCSDAVGWALEYGMCPVKYPASVIPEISAEIYSN